MSSECLVVVDVQRHYVVAVFLLTTLNTSSTHEPSTEAVLHTSTSSLLLRKLAIHAPYINISP